MSPRAAEYDYEDDDEEEEEDDQQQNGQQQQKEPRLSRSDLRALRKKAKDFDEMQTKLAAMERKELFREAGINPNDPKTKYFIKGYDGELTAEKIQEEAIAAGLIEAKETPNEEVASHQKMDGAAAGASPPGKVNPLDKVMQSDPKSLDEFIAAAQEAGIPTSLTGTD